MPLAAVRLRATTRDVLESGSPTGQACVPLHEEFDEHLKSSHHKAMSHSIARESTNCSTIRRRERVQNRACASWKDESP